MTHIPITIMSTTSITLLLLECGSWQNSQNPRHKAFSIDLDIFCAYFYTNVVTFVCAQKVKKGGNLKLCIVPFVFASYF